MRSFLLGALFLQFFIGLPTGWAGGLSWKIKKDHWSDADEREFSDFVQRIALSDCHTADSCLKSPANPYHASDPPGLRLSADCGHLPYLFRSYFAWKNGLPFSYASDVQAVDGSGDLRYSPDGNRITARMDLVTPAPGRFPDFSRAIAVMLDTVDTAMFRFNPSSDDPRLFTDFYSTAITRGGVRPGTVIYDPNGHAATVYQVEDDGRVDYIDAHPDFSVTRGTYGMKFERSRPGMGAGFKNWRPLRLVGYDQDGDGDLIGGRVVAASNREIPDFSLEQYYGASPSPDGNWARGTFEVNGQKVDYYDFVRMRLAKGDLHYQPIHELTETIDELCSGLRDRATAVQRAVDEGLSAQPHPERLPANIYGTSGNWEEYATPARDAELKTSFKEIQDRVAQFLELERDNPSRLNYQGSDLKGDLLRTYEARGAACTIRYRKSNGDFQELSFHEVTGRLFALSFDPYHCPELRWGATDPSELSSCPDDANKREWYQAEQRLRNQLERKYDARMDFSLEDLERLPPPEGDGIATPPEVDLEPLLKQ